MHYLHSPTKPPTVTPEQIARMTDAELAKYLDHRIDWLAWSHASEPDADLVDLVDVPPDVQERFLDALVSHVRRRVHRGPSLAALYLRQGGQP